MPKKKTLPPAAANGDPAVKPLHAASAQEPRGAASGPGAGPSLGALLKQHPFLSITPLNRIHCTVTKHDVQPNAAAVQAHLASKAFRKAQLYAGDFSKFLPHIVAHKYSDRKLYCTLTKLTLNRIMPQVERHAAGRKFMRLKAEFDEKQARREARAKRKAEKAARWAARQKRREAAGGDGDGSDGNDTSSVSSSSEEEGDDESSGDDDDDADGIDDDDDDDEDEEEEAGEEEEEAADDDDDADEGSGEARSGQATSGSDGRAEAASAPRTAPGGSPTAQPQPQKRKNRRGSGGGGGGGHGGAGGAAARAGKAKKARRRK